MAESAPFVETLIDYHFGTLGAEAAARVEERLLSDGELLRAYLQLKRQLDASTISEAPSARARDRLRRAVVAAHGPGAGRSLRRWLARPVPLYQTLAVAAAVGVVVSLFGFRAPIPEGPPPGGGAAALYGSGPVDSSRARPASLEVF